MKVEIKCDYCGKLLRRYPSQVKEHNFCGRACVGKYSSKVHNPDGYKRYRNFSINSKLMHDMNIMLNPTRMTEATRHKLSDARYGTGDKTEYRKRNGRHVHRIIAEQKIGRPLKPGEVVHHIDGDKRNNNPDNLLVLPSQMEHARLHAAQDRREGVINSEVHST